ncbi:MAG: HNH endonuclease signature motif containing protein [Minicystis sp.]
MRDTLIKERLGPYCSYCEFPVHHTPHAEHIIPKDRFREWRDRWDNLLVSCSWCNSHKGKDRPSPETVDDYLWPTRDNTAAAFTYANAVPEVADGLTGELRKKAAMLRGLVKLGVTGDARATARAAALEVAQRYFSRMATSPDPELVRESIVELASTHGFFSVWMEVCAGNPLLRHRLIDQFRGTAQDCFDPTTTATVPRPGGRL